MDKQEKLYPILVNRLPEFITDEYPKFLEFMTEYFMWLESTGADGTVNYTRALLDFAKDTDIASQSDAYIDTILRSLGFTVSRDMTMGKHFLAMFVKDFYLSRGSEKSFRFLFKLFFNKDVRIDYPRKMLARASSNEYGSKLVMLTTGNSHAAPAYKVIVEDETAHFSTILTGLVSGTQASVEKIVDYTINGEHYLEFTIIEPETSFIPGESVQVSFDTFKFIESNVKCGELTIGSGGTFYQPADPITVSMPGMIQSGSYRVKRAASGSIDGVSILSAGAGYMVGDGVYPVESQNGAGFWAEVSSVGPLGEIIDIDVITPGWRYNSIPDITVSSKTGTGSALKATSTSIGKIVEIETISPVMFTTKTQETVSVGGSGTGANIIVRESATYRTPAKFADGVNGVLGRKCVLTDSRLYQQYSYELISDESPESYRDLMSLVHPVGYQRFNVMSMVSTSEKLTIKDVLMWRVKLKVEPYRKVDFPSSNLLMVASTRVMMLRIIASQHTKPACLSINTIDKVKFSPNLGYLPLDIHAPVMDGVNSSAFINEALDAEINIITV